MYESTNVAKRIRAAAQAHGIQVGDMFKDLGLSKNALSTMYSGSMIKADSLARIADYLGCSTDYLLGRDDAARSAAQPGPAGAGAVSFAELAAIGKFRSLDPRGQSNVLAVLEHEYQASAGERPASSVPDDA